MTTLNNELLAFASATSETMSLAHWRDKVVVFSRRAGASDLVLDRFETSIKRWYLAGETVESAIGNLMCATRACRESLAERSADVRAHMRSTLKACEVALARKQRKTK